MNKILFSIFLLSFTAQLGFASFSYKCRAHGDEGRPEFDLVLMGNKGTVSADGETNEMVRDLDYSSRGDAKSQRFYSKKGFSIFGDREDGYSVSLILNGYLVEGKPRGYAHVRARGEGFFNYTYKCFRQ